MCVCVRERERGGEASGAVRAAGLSLSLSLSACLICKCYILIARVPFVFPPLPFFPSSPLPLACYVAPRFGPSLTARERARVTLRANARQVDGATWHRRQPLHSRPAPLPETTRTAEGAARRRVTVPLGDAADPTAGPPRAADRHESGVRVSVDLRRQSGQASAAQTGRRPNARARAAQPPPAAPAHQRRVVPSRREASRSGDRPRTGRLQPPARRYLVVLVVVAAAAAQAPAAAAAQAPAVLARARVVGAQRHRVGLKCPRRRTRRPPPPPSCSRSPLITEI